MKKSELEQKVKKLEKDLFTSRLETKSLMEFIDNGDPNFRLGVEKIFRVVKVNVEMMYGSLEDSKRDEFLKAFFKKNNLTFSVENGIPDNKNQSSGET